MRNLIQLLEIFSSEVGFDCRKIVGLIRNRDFSRLKILLNILSVPTDCLEQTKINRQVVAFVKKFDFKVDTTSATYEAFAKSENHCKIVNGTIFKGAIFDKLKEDISLILGPLNNNAFDKISKLAKHGPGSTGSKISDTQGGVKDFLIDKSCSSGASLYLYLCAENSLLSTEGNLCKQNHNLLATVPKTFYTGRNIAVEPTINMYLQRGVGDYISNRLKSVGIDLRDQSRNKIAAQKALFCGYSTLDLQAASDTISLNCVRTLLPDDWYDLLYSLRSHSYLAKDGNLYPYEKFSSQGNGYTFALESLIFTAVCRAHTDTYFVYGDDIIIPDYAAPSVINTLNELGFELNSEKSFLTGPFYESCGGDYFCGVDITPIYLKEWPVLACDFARLYNGLKLRGYEKTAKFVLSYVKKPLFVPENQDMLSGFFSDNEPGYEWTQKVKNFSSYISVYRQQVKCELTFRMLLALRRRITRPLSVVLLWNNLRLRIDDDGWSWIFSDDLTFRFFSKRLFRRKVNMVSVPIWTLSSAPAKAQVLLK